MLFEYFYSSISRWPLLCCYSADSMILVMRLCVQSSTGEWSRKPFDLEVICSPWLIHIQSIICKVMPWELISVVCGVVAVINWHNVRLVSVTVYHYYVFLTCIGTKFSFNCLSWLGWGLCVIGSWWLEGIAFVQIIVYIIVQAWPVDVCIATIPWCESWSCVIILTHFLMHAFL